MTLNKKRKYSHIKLAGNSGVLFTALHVTAEKWCEGLGFTLKTGGEVDFITANYYTKVAKKNRNILRKVTRYQCHVETSERLTGNCQ